LDGHFF